MDMAIKNLPGDGSQAELDKITILAILKFDHWHRR